MKHWTDFGQTFDLVASHSPLPLFEEATENLLILADLEPGQRVLELGCGKGLALGHCGAIVGVSGEVLGIDISEAMVEASRSHCEGLGLAQVRVEVGDMDRLDLREGVFDRVLSGFGLFFSQRPAACVAELVRSLAPGGRVLFSTWQRDAFEPLRSTWADVLLEVTGDILPPRPWAQLETPEACRALLEGAGARSPQVHRVEYQLPMSDQLAWRILQTTRLRASLLDRSPETLRALEIALLERIEGWTELNVGYLIASGGASR